jgi:hypothetical protein
VTTAFGDLCKAVPPPDNPFEAGRPEGFTAVEGRLGLALPTDYKSLIGAYGAGSWKGFLWVLNPFASNRYLNLFEQTQRQLDAERTIRADWPKDVPFALYPEPGGLLPWAMTDNGDRLYWVTEGRPDTWDTVVYESRGPEYDRHRMSCCEFLRRWVAGELRVSVFPDDFEYGFVGAFEPYRPDGGAAA